MAPKIQMVDLHGQYLRIKPQIDQAIQQVIDSASFIQGEAVHGFARALSGYLGGAPVVPCANGTDALQIALMALDLKPGMEVIVPVHTYVATAEVIALLGLKPVFVDVDPATFTIDTDQAAAAITSKTKAIVPVNLYGQCARLEPLLGLATRHNLSLVEDNAQALGAAYTCSDGSTRKAGTLGQAGAMSFFPSKNLGCFGDGGALTTPDAALAARMAMIANHGQQEKYHHQVVGINSRLDSIQAAILQVKLRYLDEYTAQRNQAALRYDHLLGGISGIQIPVRAPYSTHVFHQYTIRAERRDALRAFLAQAGIPSMIYYPLPLHLQKAYQQWGYQAGSFPVAEKLSQTVLSLPIHTELTASEQSYIGDTIQEFYTRHG